MRINKCDSVESDFAFRAIIFKLNVSDILTGISFREFLVSDFNKKSIYSPNPHQLWLKNTKEKFLNFSTRMSDIGIFENTYCDKKFEIQTLIKVLF